MFILERCKELLLPVVCCHARHESRAFIWLSEDDLLQHESTDSNGSVFCAIDTYSDYDVTDYEDSSDTAQQ